jgi:multiple sugar transport system ATP-binding protein
LARVELRGVAKVYPGGVEAIRGLDLTIEDGALFVIVGPSGSGKSTLLRLIAGLEPPSAGSLWIDGTRVDRLAPRDRDVAMVFQTPVLYPYLSVFENLAFGLRARRAPRSEVDRLVPEIAAVLGLGGKLDRRPATLSGGERQRVALGRALVRRPRVFLLDEPFSSLDAPLRTALRSELGDLQRRLGTTMIHVTHDQAEARALGTRVAILHEGRILQDGTPWEIYERPTSRLVGEFMGSPPMSILPCVVETAAGVPGLRLRIEAAPGDGWTIDDDAAWAGPLPRSNPGRVNLGIRAEHVRTADTPDRHAGPADARPWFVEALVHRLEPHGHETLATLTIGPHVLSALLPPHARLVPGETVAVGLDPTRIVWFDAGSGRALDSQRSV